MGRRTERRNPKTATFDRNREASLSFPPLFTQDIERMVFKR
jgi:hypothetical protein